MVSFSVSYSYFIRTLIDATFVRLWCIRARAENPGSVKKFTERFCYKSYRWLRHISHSTESGQFQMMNVFIFIGWHLRRHGHTGNHCEFIPTNVNCKTVSLFFVNIQHITLVHTHLCCFQLWKIQKLSLVWNFDSSRKSSPIFPIWILNPC